MAAHRADLRRLDALMDISAVGAHPYRGPLGGIVGILLQHLCQLPETFLVDVFDLCNLVESGRNLKESFLLCRIPECLVDIRVLLVLVVLCRAQKPGDTVLLINGIRPVDVDRLP